MTLPEKTIRFFEWEIQELALEYPDHIPMWLFMRLDEAEPAPPKDWRPYCYLPTFRVNNDCSEVKTIEGTDELWDVCKQCPYRKMEAEK